MVVMPTKIWKDYASDKTTQLSILSKKKSTPITLGMDMEQSFTQILGLPNAILSIYGMKLLRSFYWKDRVATTKSNSPPWPSTHPTNERLGLWFENISNIDKIQYTIIFADRGIIFKVIQYLLTVMHFRQELSLF